MIDDMQLRAELQAMESDIIGRMDLLEVLSQDGLAANLQPNAALAEQLMHLKGKLSGKALENARSLIRRYVDALAAVLRDECHIAEKHFKKVAKSYWADTAKKDREDAEMQMDLFDLARSKDPYKPYEWLNGNCATAEIEPRAMQ